MDPTNCFVNSLAITDLVLRAIVWVMMMKMYDNLRGVLHNVDRLHRDQEVN